jgi:lipooligosaccharide transport system permease protein
MLGEVGPGLLVHVAYLAVLGLLGLVAAARRLERLLLS